jgi:hypothetical protein
LLIPLYVQIATMDEKKVLDLLPAVKSMGAKENKSQFPTLAVQGVLVWALFVTFNVAFAVVFAYICCAAGIKVGKCVTSVRERDYIILTAVVDFSVPRARPDARASRGGGPLRGGVPVDMDHSSRSLVCCYIIPNLVSSAC